MIYVVVGFRPGHPEVSARNKTFAALASSEAFAGADPAARVHPAVAPDPADLVLTKRRVSAFAGSDLDVLLRGLAADTLVLAGIATSGVVLSTLRQAADLDYRLVVLADGCLDADAEVHRVLTEKVFPARPTCAPSRSGPRVWPRQPTARPGQSLRPCRSCPSAGSGPPGRT